MDDINKYRNALNKKQKKIAKSLWSNPFLNPAGWYMQHAKDKKAEQEAYNKKAEQDRLAHNQQMQQLSQRFGTSAGGSNATAYIIAGVSVVLIAGLIYFTTKKSK